MQLTREQFDEIGKPFGFSDRTKREIYFRYQERVNSLTAQPPDPVEVRIAVAYDGIAPALQFVQKGDDDLAMGRAVDYLHGRPIAKAIITAYIPRIATQEVRGEVEARE